MKQCRTRPGQEVNAGVRVIVFKSLGFPSFTLKQSQQRFRNARFQQPGISTAVRAQGGNVATVTPFKTKADT